MQTKAVVLERPTQIDVADVALARPGPGDVVVDVDWSGVSTGTERLLFDGRMPSFPGMGYPLVPGYEAVGRVVDAGPDADLAVGAVVFVPGARCFEGGVRALFGGASARLVAASERCVEIDPGLGADAAAMALAATAYHAMAGDVGVKPNLIVGHGALGRLLARLATMMGGAPPVVWERDPARVGGAAGYQVVDPSTDRRRDYGAVYDVSGDAGLLNELIGRLAPGGEVVLAGFYSQALSFDFAPAFMREARLRVAAEWRPADMRAVRALVDAGRLDLSGVVTHVEPATAAPSAYATAFNDSGCLKMALDWRAAA